MNERFTRIMAAFSGFLGVGVAVRFLSAWIAGQPVSTGMIEAIGLCLLVNSLLVMIYAFDEISRIGQWRVDSKYALTLVQIVILSLIVAVSFKLLPPPENEPKAFVISLVLLGILQAGKALF